MGDVENKNTFEFEGKTYAASDTQTARLTKKALVAGRSLDAAAAELKELMGMKSLSPSQQARLNSLKEELTDNIGFANNQGMKPGAPERHATRELFNGGVLGGGNLDVWHSVRNGIDGAVAEAKRKSEALLDDLEPVEQAGVDKQGKRRWRSAPQGEPEGKKQAPQIKHYAPKK
jgi:hypothetical protein